MDKNIRFIWIAIVILLVGEAVLFTLNCKQMCMMRHAHAGSMMQGHNRGMHGMTKEKCENCDKHEKTEKTDEHKPMAPKTETK